jgi:UDP-glucose 4-epimerase
MANKQMSIVITGSAGYIGTPLAYELLNMGYKIIGIDNYVNSNSKNTEKLKKDFIKNYNFYNLDIALEPSKLNAIFLQHKPELVIHLAALKSVQESISSPDLYKNNNINSTINILDSMSLNDCKKIIYSSSAAVYGDQKIQPIHENVVLNPSSPYAYTKLLCEKIINNACDQNNINGISLRYFNPIGYHTSKLFSDELTEDVGSIMQQIIKVALGREKFLNIYGSDYSTKDGTCERDFIHIEDVLDAHIKSIKYIDSSNGHEIFNIGTGLPISILKLINFFIKKNNIPINYEFTERKLGDIESCYADVEKINKKMKWKASKNIEDMVADAWKAHSK